MYPPLIVELLAAAHQRELLEAATHEHVATALVGHASPWWNPIVSSLRHLATAAVSRSGSADVRRRLAVTDRA